MGGTESTVTPNDKSKTESQSSTIAVQPTNSTKTDEKDTYTETKKVFNVEKKVAIGCIGVGARLCTLISVLLKQHPELVEIVAIADEEAEALRLAKPHITRHSPNVEIYSDYQQLLARPDIDWVLIGSKNYLHAPQCIAAFKAQKHVFCEKPLATTIEDGIQILEAQRQSGKLFATGFVLRHAPLYETIHKIVCEDRLLGPIVSVEANETLYPGHGGYIFRNWRRFVEQAGPHILEKCCHDIDILMWLIESVPSTVAAFGGLDVYKPENEPKDEHVLKLYKTWMHAYEDVNPFLVDKTIEDNVVAVLKFRNGVKATFHTNCNAAWPQRRILICGVKGTLEADLVTNKIKYQVIGMKKEKIAIKTTGGHGGGDKKIIEDLCESMAYGKIPKATGEEGFRSAIVCLAIDEARRTGQMVDIEKYWSRFGI